MAQHIDPQDLIEGIEEPALVVRHERVIIANEAARRLLGDRIVGADIRLVIRHPVFLDHLLGGRQAEIEIKGIGESGRSWIVTLAPLRAGQTLVRLRDHSLARAAEKMRVDFVANASHELKTPLTTILGYSETIAESDDLEPEFTSRFASIIRNEADRMLRIIDDLMSLSRIEAERFMPLRERIDIAELLTGGVGQVKPLANRMQCDIRPRIQQGLPPVTGDRAQLIQVIDNLLSNALRYGCRSAGCTVTAECRGSEDHVELVVSDNGQGVPPEHLPRLTERFYRVDATRSRDSGGTGLGLAIVKHIVERHRGSLKIESTPGKGTLVTVRLPATVA